MKVDQETSRSLGPAQGFKYLHYKNLPEEKKHQISFSDVGRF